MKIILLISCFLVLTVASYSQQNHPSKPLTYDDYMKKSKDQKNAGWLMLGGGVLMISVGTLIIFGKGIFGADDTDSILPLVGAGTAIGSIPFFISSGNNKRKAGHINLGFQPETFPGQSPIILGAQPAITIKIGL